MLKFLAPDLHNVLGKHVADNVDENSTTTAENSSRRVLILYSSMQGLSEQWAQTLRSDIGIAYPRVEVLSMDKYQFDDLANEAIVLFLVSTYDGGKPAPSGEVFCKLLEDFAWDFRVDKTSFESIRYSVVGFGSDAYDRSYFCTPAKQIDRNMHKLGGRRLQPMCLVSDTRDIDAQLESWRQQLPESVTQISQKLDPVHEDVDNSDSESDYSDAGVVDDDIEHASSCMPPVGDSPEMVTNRQRAQLTKEGYKIIGTHSAVKLCRWTKAQLRGRGGCYKHTMYGISSYNCMEATPSLACANKCVFCWRHHKNPVGTSWRWKMDDPNDIVQGAIDLHVRSIRELRGVPGVLPERFLDAQTVRHCALSLVGEPIMYPRINEMIDDLHSRDISTFLVTNCQFPDAIRSLQPVTQLYVSVDAADPISLKEVDRPLFSDYWERFLACLDALRQKQQRTVYRLTLVDQYNMTDAAGYAHLIERGQPDFIEIKAVTYCGESKGSDLTMKNVPWHDDVVEYSRAICESTPFMRETYEMASEHRHSCIVLLAKKKFKIDGWWHTWIDYPKFHALARSGKTFTTIDYMAPTPHWAVAGAEEEGFDPADKRFYRKGSKNPGAKK